MANQDSPKAELAALRAEVDEIDQQIILLLGVRFRCTDMIGELKQANDMDLVDPVREDQQVQRIRRLAEEAGVPPALAETILREVIDTVVDHHTRLRERPYS
ncbi:chorismate mutase [Achromobacter xylosoxidans]|jgi:chorismate mutase|uniref:chorismate mutase n=2 Tax=Achromobacter TaxID=222 RepID=A0A1D8I8Z2_9BURK|nr:MULTISPECIES: chorismate mutase [Achromobacter]AKP89878.1 chorismate mutase [Achromobacter xylosoxidans]AMG46180.1 chorismate mutase [Achromobacter xylosoxidans]AOU92928.1 chorismate mutase [Achromobacter ruhlandii]MCI1837542.1 chorismate mutase [Achromobacter ruhlandii]MCZ8395508.1 chorismate mutase [Achromobacter ruhlandii]